MDKLKCITLLTPEGGIEEVREVICFGRCSVHVMTDAETSGKSRHCFVPHDFDL